MSDSAPLLVWFRDDLRLADNPALAEAAADGRPVIVLYVLDEESEGMRPLGGAARWWLHHSLAALRDDLARLGAGLVLARGKAAAIVPALARRTGAAAVHWNRRYGPGGRVDGEVRAALEAADVPVCDHHANLLFEPGSVRTKAGGAYSVFTPFWRAAMAGATPRKPVPPPSRIATTSDRPPSDALEDWKLLPTEPDWAGGLRDSWTPGEAGAAKRLRRFVDQLFDDYPSGREMPAEDGSSRLSPHLRFGEISPFQVWWAVRGGHDPRSRASQKFLAELGWREFNWQLLDRHPDLATANLDRRFDSFPWARKAPAKLAAWQRGRTGFPIVDAGMRQLWTTGWMHNRVRMVAASFLIKDLLQDWRIGEAWFWDTLVDADPANNPANWQWVAGSGADAQPFFRIFNPKAQGERYDPDGAYARSFIPELTSRGGSYPEAIVDHSEARQRALAALRAMRGTSAPG